MSWWPSRLAVLAFVLLSACAFGDPTMDAADTGRRDAGRSDAESSDAGPSDADPQDAGTTDTLPTGPRIEVGTGAIQFEPLSGGQVIDLSSGPQGGGRFNGFHIWFGARSWELDPMAITATFIVLRKSDRAELARLEWVTNFRPATGGGSHEIWGANPRLMDCCEAVSEELVMRVEVVDADGVAAADEIEVVGQDECADFSTSYCP